MKNQIGSPVRGDDFFKRDALTKKAWGLIQSGAHILIAAPRRVGKTSLMRYLEDHPQQGFSFLFNITESVSNENEFFRRIMNKLLRTDYVRKSRKVMAFLGAHLPQISPCIASDRSRYCASRPAGFFISLSRSATLFRSAATFGQRLLYLGIAPTL